MISLGGDGGEVVMAPGVVTADLRLSVGGFQDRLGQWLEHGIATEAEDKIGLGILQHQWHQLGISEMRVTAPDPVGVGPHGAPAPPRPLDDPGVLRA